MGGEKRERAARARKQYSQGELNKLIDDFLHPFYKANANLVLVDGFLHALVERNPQEPVRKFIKYSAPKILKQLSKKSR